MRIRTIVLAAATLGLGPASWVLPNAVAQPLWDVVKVTLPYTVTLGHKTLPPGSYTIEQLHSVASPPVLLIYSDNGMKFQTNAMTIRTQDPRTPEDTVVTLHRLDNDKYYFDKIWIQGKNAGYEFPLPSSVRAREKEMAEVKVNGQATTKSTPTEPSKDIDTDADDTAATTQTQTSDAQSSATSSQSQSTVTTADATPPPSAPAYDSSNSQSQNGAGYNSSSSQAQNNAGYNSSNAQNQSSMTNSPNANSSNDASMANSANRQKRDTDDTTNSPRMPATSAGWLTMLLSGGTLSGMGLMLRRKR